MTAVVTFYLGRNEMNTSVSQQLLRLALTLLPSAAVDFAEAPGLAFDRDLPRPS